MPDLLLDLPWVISFQQLGEVRINRGPVNILRYEDGITLAIRLFDPADYKSVDELADIARRAAGPGVVVLVAGVIPLGWRSKLRVAEVSFIDVSGVAEIRWPRLIISTGQFARSVQRRRLPMSMQKGNAAVVQELLIAAFGGEHPTVGEIADHAEVALSTASRSISQLAEHGLVDKRRDGARTRVDIIDPVSIAELLATRTAWPQGRTLSGYMWGRNIWEVASSVSSRAESAKIGLAVTGRAALSFLGVLSTSSPERARCWVGVKDEDLEQVARKIGLETTSEDESNVILAADSWNVGIHRRKQRKFDEWEASIAHPLRVWCDLREEQRGAEFAAQLWKEIDQRGKSINHS